MRPRPAVLTAVAAVSSTVLLLLAPSVFARAASVLVALLPLAVALLVDRLRGAPGVATWLRLSRLIAVIHVAFMVAGLSAIWSRGGKLRFVGGAEADDLQLLRLVTGLSILAGLFVAGMAWQEARLRPHEKPPRDTTLALLGHATFALAAIGLARIVWLADGVAAARAALSLHQRDVSLSLAGDFGSSLWSLCALPAMVLVAYEVWDTRVAWRRNIALAQLSVLLVSQVFIFGSRLNLVLAGIGILVLRHGLTGRSLTVRQAAAGGGAFAALSAVVLTQRAAAIGAGERAGIVEILGYSILDVSASLSLIRERVAEQIGDVDRYVPLLSSVIPTVGPNARELSEKRLDVIIARAIGTQHQAEGSGLPPSLPTALYIGYGTLTAVALMLALGLLVGWLETHLANRGSAAAVFALALLTIFVINVYKSGDIPLDLAGEARRWLYLIVGYLLCRFLVSRRAVADVHV